MLRRTQTTVTPLDAARGAALNEQEPWREMVRWSGGRIVEERGVRLVSGPSPYLRVAIRTAQHHRSPSNASRDLRFGRGLRAPMIGQSRPTKGC